MKCERRWIIPKKRNTSLRSESPNGDQITVGDVVQSTGVAIGRSAQATVTQTSGITTDKIAEVFDVLATKVNALPTGPNKQVAQSAVQGLQEEAKRGEKANEANVSNWFNFLAQAAPDAFEVAVASFANPIAGLSLAFKKVADRASQERSNKS